MKARYLKAALGISKFTLSPLAYLLARETFLVENLRLKHLLPSNQHYEAFIEERRKKRKEIWPEFYCTDAMICKEWM